MAPEALFIERKSRSSDQNTLSQIRKHPYFDSLSPRRAIALKRYPVVRGNTGAKIQSGMKLPISGGGEWSIIERLSRSQYNEGCVLKRDVDRSRKHCAHYYESLMPTKSTGSERS